MLFFALAALALLWPVRAVAAGAATSGGPGDRLTLSDFSTRGCGWEIHIGAVPHTPAFPTRGQSAGGYAMDQFFASNCTAARYSRESEAATCLLLGSVLGARGLRRRLQTATSQLSIFKAEPA